MNKRERQKKIRAQKQAAANRKKTFKHLALIAGAAILIAAIGFTIWQQIQLDVPTLDEVTEQDIVKGFASAPLTLVEYSDFQCPACRAQHRTINSAWKDVNRKVKLVYRHFPLTRLHPHATLAAHYAEAAKLQDKFWEMHDLLFDTQRTWSKLKDPSSQFNEYANRLQLDMEQLNIDMQSDKVKDKIQADIASARKAGISSTPTLYLDGELLSNVRDKESFIEAIVNAADLKETSHE